MYDHLDKHFKNDDRVFIHPNPWNKRKYTYDVLEALVQNFEYCKKLNIIGTYFIMLASNCMFHKQLDLSELKTNILNLPLSKPDIPPNTKESHNSTWNHWASFFKNEGILTSFNNISIFNFMKGQHEGLVIEYDIFNMITNFIRENRIKYKITSDASFEEIIPITLYHYFTNKRPYCICKVFWHLPNYMPNIDQIRETNEPCVKRVDLNINHNVRLWLRSLQTNIQ